MKAKNYVNQIREYNAKITMLENEIADMYLIQLQATKPDNDIHINSDADKMLNIVMRIDKMKTELEKMKDEYLSKRLEIVSKICQMPNELYVKVVYDHKCRDMSFREIAKKYNYSVSHIKNTYSSAMRELEKIVNDSTK